MIAANEAKLLVNSQFLDRDPPSRLLEARWTLVGRTRSLDVPETKALLLD